MTDYCLCCGKSLENERSEGFWHTHCIRKFFEAQKLPILDLNKAKIEQLARSNISVGISVPGVQKKLSFALSKKRKRGRLIRMELPAGYILKPQSEEYPHLPELEAVTMLLADAYGIPTCPHGLIQLSDGSLAYITKRVDRKLVDGAMVKLPMEDFCQLSSRLTEDKYKGSYEQIARLIDRYSSRPYGDKVELYNRLIFCYLTWNSDMHLKNFSLLEEASEGPVLSPAYDLLPAGLVVKEDSEETALTLNGKKKNLTRNDFLVFAETIGISLEVAKRLLEAMLGKEKLGEDVLSHAFLPKEEFAEYLSAFRERNGKLTQ